MNSYRCQLTYCVTIAAGVMFALAPAARGGAHGIDVILKTVSEEAMRGQLVALSLSDGVLLRTAAGEHRLPLCDLVRITAAAPLSPRGQRDFMLALTNGDVLYGKLVDTRDEAVVIDTADLGRIPVALESIASIDTARAAQPAYRKSVEWLDRVPTADEDRILLTNGDIIRGFITSVDADGIGIDSVLGDTVVPHRRVVAVRLASTRAPAPAHPYLIVTFRTSGRLTVTDLNWSGNVIEARLSDSEQVRIEAERIVRLDVVGGRWEWLSQHRPISFEHTPMLSLDWEYVADRNVLGKPITVAGERFEHGIGVHSRSSLTYDLKGAYGEFVTSFGIDDDSGPYADVTVFILVDGQRRFEQAHVRRGTLQGPVRLDVTRANRIELVVDFGDNGDLQDRFNWVEPALIR